MKKGTKVKAESTKAKEREHADLLKEALKQPGVKEAMEVYESYRALENDAQPYRRAMKVSGIITLSDATEPANWPIE